MEEKNNAKLQNKYEKVYRMTFVIMTLLKLFYFFKYQVLPWSIYWSPLFCRCTGMSLVIATPDGGVADIACHSNGALCFPSFPAGVSISGMKGSLMCASQNGEMVHLLYAGL